jgi:hypothetical protein
VHGVDDEGEIVRSWRSSEEMAARLLGVKKKKKKKMLLMMIEKGETQEGPCHYIVIWSPSDEGDGIGHEPGFIV